jgi:hypothetical protein
MNLLRSICCLFGNRCEGEEPKPTKETTRDEPLADLGQKEAELEKTGKEQMGHMESGDASKTAQQPTKRGTLVAPRATYLAPATISAKCQELTSKIAASAPVVETLRFSHR